MQRATGILAGSAIGLGALLGTGWLGLRVEPAPFPPYSDPAAEPATVAVPAGLPPPVSRYFRAVLGDRVPIIESAVLSGRGRLRFSGLTFPSRLRLIHAAGRGYRHSIESTRFGAPVLKVNETYLDGHARLELPFGVVRSPQARTSTVYSESAARGADPGPGVPPQRPVWPFGSPEARFKTPLRAAVAEADEAAGQVTVIATLISD